VCQYLTEEAKCFILWVGIHGVFPPPHVYYFVVVIWSETWSLTLREEHRLRVFENRVLRNIFGPKRDEVTGEWRKLHNK
jgi:hypothetical protein